MIYRFILKLVRRRRMECDLEAELAFHREMSGEGGVTFGNSAVIKEQAFDLWRFTTLENLWRDAVYGLRGLRRHPALVVTALVSLALGIGANTALFSVGMELLLSEPSVTGAASLVHITFNGNSHADSQELAICRESNLFQEVAGENGDSYINWNNGQETRPIFGTVTTRNFFTMLGVPMAYGRGYAATDPDQVAVLHHQFWMRHFKGDPAVIGRSITLDGRSFTVVGVLPRDFRTLIGFGFSPDVYVPSFLEHTPLTLYARLKTGMALGEAQQAAQVLAKRAQALQTVENRNSQPWANVEAIAGLARLQNDQTKLLGAFFLILLMLAGMVLLIACANVASLLLARASTRKREVDVRLSLGASRGRLMQQFLIESLLLSLAGAACGLGLAGLLNHALSLVTLPAPVPIRLHAELDWRVALYAAALSTFATLACGLLPAWQSVRESMTHHVRGTGRMFIRRAIVVGQVAVSIVLLSTGFLFVRNLLRSSALSPGFDVRNTIRSQVSLPAAAFKDPKRVAEYAEQGVQAIAGVPGVTAAAAARLIPFTDANTFGSELRFAGMDRSIKTKFNWNAVTSGYFETLAIPVVAGRAFQTSDSASSDKLVILSTGFVNRYLKCSPVAAVGRTFRWSDKPSVYRVIGVAANTKNMTIGEVEGPQLYEHLANIDVTRDRLQFVARSAVAPATLLKPIDSALRKVNADAGVETQTVWSSIGFAFLPSQIGAAVLGGIGLLGLLLAMIGLYGVMAYSVARRTPEIGVRMAIGAPASSIFQLILIDAGRMVALGSAIGIGVALVATRPLGLFLIDGLPPHDPVTFVAVLMVFGLTAALASWGPARRATAIDPMSCLRHD